MRRISFRSGNYVKKKYYFNDTFFNRVSGVRGWKTRGVFTQTGSSYRKR